jgi:nascent polypeptide-associated complex subunit alpha
MLVTIDAAELLKNPNGDMFVVFGEPKANQGADMAQNAQYMAALQQLQQNMAKGNAAAGGEEQPSKVEEVGEGKTAASAQGAATSVDEKGVDAKDIELVMTQVSDARKMKRFFFFFFAAVFNVRFTSQTGKLHTCPSR